LNILTKISIVVLVVLTLVTSAVFIRLSVVPANYRQAYEAEKAKNDWVVGNANVLTAALDRAKIELDQLRKAQSDSAQELANKTTEMNNQLAAEKVRYAELDSSLKTATRDLTELKGSLALAETSRQETSKSLEVSRERSNQQATEIQHLSSALNESQSKVANMQLALRSLEEKIAQQETLIRDYQDKLAKGAAPATAAGGEATAAVAPGDLKVSGAVTAVSKDAVSINIGSAKGLKGGMVLVIYRGDEFVSHVRVQEVDANQSAGIVFDKRSEPMQGDKVATSAMLR
jgi:predicted  nucleic acid-binding Zn-ribbon protein